jgi:hypothetical protein
LHDVVPVVVDLTVPFVFPLSSVFAFTVPDVSALWEHLAACVLRVKGDQNAILVGVLRLIFGKSRGRSK